MPPDPARARCPRASRPSTTSCRRASPPRCSPRSGGSSARSWTSSPARATRRRGGPSPRPLQREIAPITLPDGTVFDDDEGMRVPVNWEKLASLAPSFKPDGVVTAGNSSQISDGAAALLITSRGAGQGARAHAARAHRRHRRSPGVDPTMMLTGPIPATQRVLKKAGLKIDDIDLFEINEAFASVALAWERELHPDLDRVNVNGGAIALGHPLGCSGARLMNTLLHELERSQEALRPSDDVHRLRPGDRHHHRAAVAAARDPASGPSASLPMDARSPGGGGSVRAGRHQGRGSRYLDASGPRPPHGRDAEGCPSRSPRLSQRRPALPQHRVALRHHAVSCLPRGRSRRAWSSSRRPPSPSPSGCSSRTRRSRSEPSSDRTLRAVIAAAVLLGCLPMVRHRFIERPDIALMVFLAFTIYALNAYLLEGRRLIFALPLSISSGRTCTRASS